MSNINNIVLMIQELRISGPSPSVILVINTKLSSSTSDRVINSLVQLLIINHQWQIATEPLM
ncbi:hypothetical protein CY34DRAFT_796837 [Suillus luteus UH-Slu-Lm8-n1]|uniref:Uncharacterized protein n=1 Tax=Suillus luteus UH-Slu-Lm8-n1 TaxID=930992 RepID=A0A0D0BIR0_9AGAM|nr:hypothetical protein CY34DRAFT_796837 [Suillus luteus UH-Slu-Lm8-n1]